MAIVSISEAAKLTGKSVKTIYRHIENGKLSCQKNDSNAKIIEISELIRVYGEIKQKNIVFDNGINSQMTEVENIENKILRQKIESLESILNEKQDHIDSLKRAMLLLENRKEEKKKNFWGSIFSKE